MTDAKEKAERIYAQLTPIQRYILDVHGHEEVVADVEAAEMHGLDSLHTHLAYEDVAGVRDHDREEILATVRVYIRLVGDVVREERVIKDVMARPVPTSETRS